MTYREYVKIHYPHLLCKACYGGVFGHPYEIFQGATKLCEKFDGIRCASDEICTKCWDQDYILDDEPSKYPKMFFSYAEADCLTTVELITRLIEARKDPRKVPEIKDVKFNGPATIVFWADGTKTVVKARDEDFDKEKGLAMAISRKALGNTRSYYNEFEKWIKEEEKNSSKDLPEKYIDFCREAATSKLKSVIKLKRK